MINENKAKSRNYCCEDISLIENYDLAINSDDRYCIHHRLETHNLDGSLKTVEDRLSIKDLKSKGLYYNRPANELIFMTLSEHVSLHHKGKMISEEHKRAISKARIGRKIDTHPEEQRRKHSEKMKGHIGFNKGMHWKLVDGKRVYYS